MNIIQSNIKTMSSREISELTGSRHDAVRKSARRLEADQILTSPLAESAFFIRGNAHQEFHFSKRDSLVLVARLSPEFTAAIVDRWQELEANQAPQIPQNFAQALQLAADQAKQLEIAAPKLEYHDKVLASTNGLTTTEIASEFNMSAIKLNRLLCDLKVQRKIGGRWVLTASMLGQELTTETTFIDDDGVSRHSMKWTEKGRKLIHELMD
jgi:phage regulator Rha-like protein